MCLCERGKFATQALFSVQVMALGSTNREVNMTDCWEGALLGEALSKLAVSSALLLMALVREFESRRGEILNLFAKI